MLWIEIRCEHLEHKDCWSAFNSGPMGAAPTDTVEGLRKIYRTLVAEARETGWKRVAKGVGAGWYCPNCAKLLPDILDNKT